MSLPSILLIYTGGTIGMKPDPETGVLAPFDFNSLHEEFPYVSKLSVRIEVVQLTPIDSSNVTPQRWVELARLIEKHYECYDGFVVLHGTDTMAYSASALSFLFDHLTKPIIFTGSQIPIGILRTDGRENLITAIEIAAAQYQGHALVPEVSICFQNHLFRANRTTKYSTEQLNAFHSENYPPLAEVGVRINYNYGAIVGPQGFQDSAQGAQTTHLQALGGGRQPLQLHTRLEQGVWVVRLFPGIHPRLLEAMVALPDLRAVVLETYGSGNAPTDARFLRTLERAAERGVILFNVTQCVSGSVAMERYQTGQQLQEVGVVSGADITTEAAVTKLMVLLGQSLPREELLAQLGRSIRGEITL